MGTHRNILLYPLSIVYGAITGIRNFLYNSEVLRSVEFHLPVICVGNITVGGTGKTPHTEYLARLLRKNFKVATLSRGYKRKTRDFRIANLQSGIREIGDEPLQIFRKFPDVLVAVDRNRVHGVRQILEEHPETEVIILDDAYQHRRITPGYSILLSDFERLIVRDHMLPYGNLRENKTNMRRADIILITKSPENISPIQRRLIVKEVDKAPYQHLFFTSLRYKNPLPVFESNSKGGEVIFTKDCGILLVTGIANPDPLKESIAKQCGELSQLAYPDHYNFDETDLEKIITEWNKLKPKEKYIVTTEKDAVRLREFSNIAESIKSVFYFIPIEIFFLNEDGDTFDNLIVDYVRKNKRNNRISES
jgi:tetraacyldisaccharide 4'-kinase